MSIEIRTQDAPPAPYPVARPANPAAVPMPAKAPKPSRGLLRIKPAPEPEGPAVVEDLLSPTSIRGFAWSLAGHAALLLILAFWYFAPKVSEEAVIDTRMAGSEFGDLSGDQLKGGLGMDTPLAMPEAPMAPPQEVTPTNTITTPSLAELKPMVTAPERSKNAAASASNGGGVNLRNPGQAGNGDGFGVAKFGHGGENINGVEVKVGDPQFTLIWDSRGDIDLHVIEPGGSEIYWEERHGTQGGELDVDDVDGFGPENVNYQLGVGPPGKYQWFVHYYGGLGGMSQPTRWKVRVKHAGNIQTYEGKFTAIGQKSKPYELLVKDGPGTKGKRTPEEARQSPEGAEITVAPKAGAMAPAPAPTPTPPSSPAPAGPRAFEPAGAGFSVVMPADPKATRKDVTTPAGASVAVNYGVERSEGAFGVTTIDLPAAAYAKLDPTKFLDDMADVHAALAGGRARLVSKIALNRQAGREVEVELPESVVAGGGLGRVRVYSVGSRVLAVSAIGTRAFVQSAEANEFFASFKITDAK